MGYSLKMTRSSIAPLTVYLMSLRPKQWVKNLLVIAAPIAAGQFFTNLFQLFLGWLSFIFASSLGYLVNDWRDRKSDQVHPLKRNRPFASGELSFKHFLFLSFFCLIATIAPLFFLPYYFMSALSIYLLITISYSFYIKQVPVLEIMWLSSGFLIRALAGSAIINEPATGWFITCLFFGALFMVSGKRLAELKSMTAVTTREVINSYSESFLRSIITMSLSITIITYCLWVFQVHPNSTFAQISILTFVFTFLMYLFSCDYGDAETPEKLLFSNKYLLTGMSLTTFLLLIVFYG
jgi:decaprenyl-phosphate phosphoribosyltransferase